MASSLAAASLCSSVSWSVSSFESGVSAQLLFSVPAPQCMTILPYISEYWEHTVYLDWYHLSEKLYTLLSMGIIVHREPDPRDEPQLVTQGKNKGTDRRKQTSLSRLYARVLERILWFGNVKEAIYYIRNIEPSHIKSQKQPDGLIGYLERKGEYIANSGVRKKAGLRNSSNGVEGLNMVNVADRQKDSLMSWRENGSSALSAIATLFINSEEEDWFFKHQISFTPVIIRGNASYMRSADELETEDDSCILPDSAKEFIGTELLHVHFGIVKVKLQLVFVFFRFSDP